MLCVQVWLHGGGFTGGSGSSNDNDAEMIADIGDVIVVTINYRLGAFGFFYTGDERMKSGRDAPAGYIIHSS